MDRILWSFSEFQLLKGNALQPSDDRPDSSLGWALTTSAIPEKPKIAFIASNNNWILCLASSERQRCPFDTVSPSKCAGNIGITKEAIISPN